MDRIVAAVAASDREGLVALWSELDDGGDALHRCVLAHHLADMYDDAGDALVWDERALAAADHIDAGSLDGAAPGVQVAALYPLLHLNIADDLRRLGSFEAAHHHVAQARARLSSFDALGPEHDAYVAMVRDLVDDIDAMVVSRSTQRRAPAPG
jgi:hypothetical protein